LINYNFRFCHDNTLLLALPFSEPFSLKSFGFKAKRSIHLKSNEGTSWRTNSFIRFLWTMAIWDRIKEADFYGTATHIIKGALHRLLAQNLHLTWRIRKWGMTKKEEYLGYLKKRECHSVKLHFKVTILIWSKQLNAEAIQSQSLFIVSGCWFKVTKKKVNKNILAWVNFPHRRMTGVQTDALGTVYGFVLFFSSVKRLR